MQSVKRLGVGFSALAAIALSATASGYGLGQPKDARLAGSAKKAAGYLLATQLDTGDWAWDATARHRSDNYGGIVAESLLAAYEQTGNKNYLDAATAYANQLVQRAQAEPELLPYKPDIELLVRLTEVAGDERYAKAATSWFGRVTAISPTGRDEVQRIAISRNGTPDILGYDVAQAIRAALAVEQFDYAKQMADAVLASRSQWLKNPGTVFGTISRAALLDALNLTDPKRYGATIAELTAALAREQDPSGTWCMNATQPTAYAVRALSNLGDQTAQQSASRGAEWLRGSMLKRGAWAHYNDGVPEPFVGDVISEVQAEALSAVIVAGKI